MPKVMSSPPDEAAMRMPPRRHENEGMSATSDRPTAPGERLIALDAVRGLALFGILMVNATLFFWPSYALGLGEPQPDGLLDQAAAWIMRFGFEGKFFTLFSLLFGIGVAMQLDRGWPVTRVVRRLLLLAAIGAAHVTLLWFGDILLYYGILGLVLVLARRAPPRRLVAWAVALLLVPIVLTAGLGALTSLAAGTPEGAAAIEQALGETRAGMRAELATAMSVYRGRDVAAMISARWAEYGFGLKGMLLNGMLLMIPAMFLLGAAAWRAGLVDGPDRERSWRRVLAWSLPPALAANTVYASTHAFVDPVAFDGWAVLQVIVFVVGGISGALAFAAGGALLLYDGLATTRALADVGRLALTNYLLQSLVMTTLALGYGLALFGRVGYAQAIGMGLVLYAFQLAASRWYLQRFRFGPVEWVWRALTYGRAPSAPS